MPTLLIHKKFAVVAMCCVWLVVPFVVYAQPSLPQAQVIELSGKEPPPPGVEAELDVAAGGGGLDCQFINISVIEASAFNPPITPKGFGLYMDCIRDTDIPLTINFYERDVSNIEIWHYIAQRIVYPNSNHTALVQVRLNRSFPIELSRIGIDVYRGSPQAGLGDWGRTQIYPERNSRCLGSLALGFDVGDGAIVGQFNGLSLLNMPDQAGGVLAYVPFGTPLILSGISQCGSDGKTYWSVQYNTLIGWVPQGDLSVNWLVDENELSRRVNIASCDGTLPSMIRVGQRARIAVIDGTPANVRVDPNGTLAAFMTIPELTTFTVVNGPWCGLNNRGENVAFWLIQLDDGTKGWVIEVTPSLRVIEPVA